MGAVSGTVDVNAPEALQALLTCLPGLTPANRTLALEGLFRGPARVTALLDGLAAGRVRTGWLSESQRKKLLGLTDPALRRRAEQLLRP